MTIFMHHLTDCIFTSNPPMLLFSGGVYFLIKSSPDHWPLISYRISCVDSLLILPTTELGWPEKNPFVWKSISQIRSLETHLTVEASPNSNVIVPNLGSREKVSIYATFVTVFMHLQYASSIHVGHLDLIELIVSWRKDKVDCALH